MCSAMWALGPSACTRPIPPEGPTAVAAAEPDLDALWTAALTVLNRMDLTPERQDRATGVIETLPTTSQQFWEWWRRDVVDSYSYAEANLHTMQRKATVRFRRLPDRRRWQVEVQIDVFRIQVPERQMTATSSALTLYSAAMPSTEGLRLDPAVARYAAPMGRDGAMEQLILDRILRVAGAADYETIEPTTAPAG